MFKIDRGPYGEKIAYVRMFSGTLRARDRLRYGKITAVSVFDGGPAVPRAAIAAGQIGTLAGLAGVRIGDALGAGRTAGRQFAPPTLETVVVPRRRADRARLHVALSQLAEQDPLINLREDDLRGEMLVSLYGEVQKEVLAATLAGDYGIEVSFRGETTICVERVAGRGAAAERIATPGNPFLAGVGLAVEPSPGSGVRYRVAGDRLGTMPPAFFKAVEETVHETLRQGLHGWQVTDVVVTLTHTGYYPRQSHAHAHFDKSMSSTAGDFRNLTPLVLMTALRQAGTVVCEPVHALRLEAPADTLGSVLPVLAGLGGTVATVTPAEGLCVVEGEIPAARLPVLLRQLPGLTRGEGGCESAFRRYQPAGGPAPSRARTDRNPLDREEYLLRVAGRVSRA